MKGKCELLKEIGAAGFALDDAGLFLDSHQDDEDALAYFHEAHHTYEQLVEEYEKNYGPLSKYRADSKRHWDWIDGPWPWQEGVK